MTLDTPLDEATPVSVWVEQKSAAGRARIVMEAPRLARTFSIDWNLAKDDLRGWDDIIAELETPAPAIPDRLVLKCGLRPWHDAPRGPGMFTLLHEAGKVGNLDWQFRRCPAEVSEWLATCIEDHAGETGTHPFVWNHNNWVLIYQGVARTAQDAALEERVLRTILRRDPENWRNREESACIALMLSRSLTAPRLLTRDDVERIGQRAIFEFRSSLGTKYTTFIYTPFLVGGLLRWRMQEPHALLIGRDPLADQLAERIAAT